MSDKYFTVNIRAYLDKDEPTYIGEESLYDLLSDFSCPKNPDVEYFLLHNAIEFTKKDQSITYLVFDAEDASLVGYFSLTVKPISVRASHISKTMAKKLSRVSILDDLFDLKMHEKSDSLIYILYFRKLPLLFLPYSVFLPPTPGGLLRRTYQSSVPENQRTAYYSKPSNLEKLFFINTNTIFTYFRICENSYK